MKPNALNGTGRHRAAGDLVAGCGNPKQQLREK